jgi:hypothetical protein
MSKANIRALLVIAVMVTMVVAVLPIQTAQAAQEPYFNWTGQQVDCSKPAFPGARTSYGYFFYDYYLPEGHVLEWHWEEQWSDYYGGKLVSRSGAFSPPPGAAFSYSGAVGAFWVDWDGGYVKYSVHIYDPSGTMIVAAETYMDCSSSWTAGGSIFDPHPPDPAIRREGTVVENTFVYGMADPATPNRDAVLTMGQMWFVIGRQEGTDGNWWYNVYISGSYGWVPASSMVLNRPFADEEDGETEAAGGAATETRTTAPVVMQNPLTGGTTAPK